MTSAELPAPPASAHSARLPSPDRVAAARPRMDRASARDLLARTAELPDTRRELLDVLIEYRAAVWAFAFAQPEAASGGS
jgi:hypothetical protein